MIWTCDFIFVLIDLLKNIIFNHFNDDLFLIIPKYIKEKIVSKGAQNNDSCNINLFKTLKFRYYRNRFSKLSWIKCIIFKKNQVTLYKYSNCIHVQIKTALCR